jgi:cytochrome c oxidase accessory protein FixG
MLDRDSMVITYHAYRGEPRGRHIKAQGRGGEKLGDCIDCNACVVVCPMGIDIRDGQQLECITCALCIDACNQVMGKLGRPLGLISYDTIANDQRRAEGLPTKFRIVRPRTVLYSALWVVVGLIMIYVLATRADLDVNVQHDRNPLFVELSNGDIRNGFTVKILNKARETRSFEIAIEGIDVVAIDVVGEDGGGSAALEVESDRLRSFRVLVTVAGNSVSQASTPIDVLIRDLAGGTVARESDQFLAPEQ